MQQKTLEFNPLDDFVYCPSCGFKLFELHAKTVCNRCGYKKGCCDLM
ncbi:MAG: hypothetical protein HYW50_03835 [Candidatus Diapherotrites archaeon]|nr:hypothetical protein [Candidatus Diapherotrites archaeon]